MKIFLKLFIPVFLFIPTLVGAATIQNISPYTLVLQKVELNQASCSPSCIQNSTLSPNSTQAYTFSGSSGSIKFTYGIYNNVPLIGTMEILATPTNVKVTNGLGTTVTLSNNIWKVNYSPVNPLWVGKFNSTSSWTDNNWNVDRTRPAWGEKNITVISSSSSYGASPKKDNYIRVKYPKGSANSGSSPPLPLGGAQFYSKTLNSDGPVTLSYYVRYPTDFPFVYIQPPGNSPYTQGKLPGLYSGIGNTGTNVPTGTDGWTMRFMWCDYNEVTKTKVKAGGELLQFTYGSNKGTYGHSYGTSLGCGSWNFANDNKWHNIQETIYLNDPGVANGQVDVCYDGKLVLTQKNIMFRKTSTLKINGVIFQTFFGGSGAEYATPINTYTDFADFAIYPYTSSTRGLCLNT